MRAWSLPATIVFVMIAACDPGIPGQVSTQYDDGKQLVLVASYSLNAQSIGIQAWADIPVGTSGTFDMTGPLHMHCDGTFQPVPSEYNDPGNRPTLDVGDSQNGAQFHAPSGHYTAVATIPSKSVHVSKSFDAGVSYRDPITGVWDLPMRCVRVADNRQELTDLTLQYTRAVQIEVGKLTGSPFGERLVNLADAAYTAVRADDRAAALDALMQIRSGVEPTTFRNPDFDIYRVANVAIALLTQPVPSD